MPLNINLQQILLHMFNTLILFGGLYFLLYKPIRNFMDNRTARYAGMKKEAEDIKAEAEEMKADYQKHLDEANAEIEAMKKEASEEIAKNRELQKEEAEKEAQEILAKAHKEAEQDRDKLMSGAENDIRAVAESAAEKLANQNLSQLYDAFLNEAEGSGLNENRQ